MTTPPEPGTAADNAPRSAAGQRGRARLLVTALAGVYLTACAAIHRPPTTIASLRADEMAARAAADSALAGVVERLAQRSRQRDTLDVLLLSGGGQTGAYGAGFLRGWLAHPREPLPHFDLISGISTGALQAPFAFLGTQRSLDTLSALYLESATRIAPTLDWLFWLRRTGGIVNVSRLRATIERVVDTSMARQIRSELASGRQLMIGTSDMDVGLHRAWDAARVLDSTAAGLNALHRVLLASASIPSIFPPVVLDRHVHSDGGVMGNLMPLLGLTQARQLAARRAALGLTTPVVVRVFVVLNIWPAAPPAVVNPASRSAISQRTSVVLFYTLQQETIERLRLLAHVVTNDVPGVRMELRVTYLPNSLSTEPGAQALFDGPFIRRVEQLGFERAQGTTPWDIIERP